jgi:hypothetical protein
MIRAIGYTIRVPAHPGRGAGTHTGGEHFMKNKLHTVLALAACVIMAGSCRMVEVASLPHTITIEIAAPDLSTYQACQLDRSGEFAPVRPVKPGRYVLSIPSMDGGYSQVGCYRYNKHIPEEYPVLRIMKGKKTIQELSIRDMEKLPVVNGACRIKVE